MQLLNVSYKGREKMSGENYWRIRNGYEPHEPTAIGEQIFYIVWCFLCGLKIVGWRIWMWITRKMTGKDTITDVSNH